MKQQLNDNNKPLILITGSNGQVGWELQRSLSCLGKVKAYSRNELDLADDDQIEKLLNSLKPDIIVNAAAYTAVDKAETERELAIQINATAPAIMARIAKNLGALFVHYSTDYVFNGEKEGPYYESDETSPVNFYGQSKLQGEDAVIASESDWIVLRTSWVYASRGHNFLRSMLRLASERNELKIVSDQIGAPTSARLIADITAHVIKQSMVERSNNEFKPDIYNLVSAGSTSWYGFACNIIDNAKSILPGIITERVLPISTDEYPTPAKRPSNSQLSCEKLERKFNLSIPEWSEHMMYCLLEINEHNKML